MGGDMERDLDTSKLLTSEQVCERLGVSPKTLLTLRRSRKISYVKLHHKVILFYPEAVETFMRRRRQAVAYADREMRRR